MHFGIDGAICPAETFDGSALTPEGMLASSSVANIALEALALFPHSLLLAKNC